jgi:hypothetical protein
MGRLEILLRVARVVATEGVEIERGGVAGVAEEHGLQFPVRTRHAQHRHIVVHDAVGIRAVPVTGRSGQPPIHRESRAGVTVREARRLEVRQHRADQLKNFLLQFGAVGFAGGGILQDHVVRRHLPEAELRTAVGVGGIQQQEFRRQPPRRLGAPLQILAQRARHADQIHRDDDQPAPAAVIEREGLDEQVLGLALRGPVARTEARHPHALLGRHGHARRRRPPDRFSPGGRGGRGTRQHGGKDEGSEGEEAEGVHATTMAGWALRCWFHDGRAWRRRSDTPSLIPPAVHSGGRRRIAVGPAVRSRE